MPHLAGTVYDAGATGGGGCTVIRTDGKGSNLGQFVGHLGDDHQLRRRADAVGNLVDLRGGHRPGW